MEQVLEPETNNCIETDGATSPSSFRTSTAFYCLRLTSSIFIFHFTFPFIPSTLILSSSSYLNSSVAIFVLVLAFPFCASIHVVLHFTLTLRIVSVLSFFTLIAFIRNVDEGFRCCQSVNSNDFVCSLLVHERNNVLIYSAYRKLLCTPYTTASVF
jgi:hypothetical protein